jgi:hypothetical protein
LSSTSAKTQRYDAGMDIFSIVHVVLSLIGILSGLVVLCGLLTANRMNGWTMLFLVTTVATSVTGFGFPFHGVTPAIILGILSLIVLTPAIAARYVFLSPDAGAGSMSSDPSLPFTSVSSCWSCRPF